MTNEGYIEDALDRPRWNEEDEKEGTLERAARERELFVADAVRRALLAETAKAWRDIDRQGLVDVLGKVKRQGKGRPDYAYAAMGIPVPKGNTAQRTKDRLATLSEKDLHRLAWLCSVHPDDAFETAAQLGVPVAKIREEAKRRSLAKWVSGDTPEQPGKEPFSVASRIADAIDHQERAGFIQDAQISAVYAAMAMAVSEVTRQQTIDIIYALDYSGDDIHARQARETLAIEHPSENPGALDCLSQRELLRLGWLCTLGSNLEVEAQRLGVDAARVRDEAGAIALVKWELQAEAFGLRQQEVQVRPLITVADPEDSMTGIRITNKYLLESANGVKRIKKVLENEIKALEDRINDRKDLHPETRQDLASFFSRPESAMLIISENGPDTKIAIGEGMIGSRTQEEACHGLSAEERRLVSQEVQRLDSAEKGEAHEGGLYFDH